MNLARRIALLGLAVSVAASSAASAAPFQNTPTPADSTAAGKAQRSTPDPQKQTARLSRKLRLTPDQAARIEPLLQSRQQQVQQLRGDTSLSPRDLHQKMRALKQSTDDQIQAILTDSQRQQYQQMQQQAMQKWRDNKKGAPTAGAEDDGDSPSTP